MDAGAASGGGPARVAHPPVYLAGLLLAGRRVVVVGGGGVARRRVPTLIDAGAQVVVVAPELHADLQPLVDVGAFSWRARTYRAGDLDGAWYVQALTDSAPVNAAVVAESERLHIFCVRADRADEGSAWTPATGFAPGVTVAAITSHDPRRAARVRDRLVDVVIDEGL